MESGKQTAWVYTSAPDLAEYPSISGDELAQQLNLTELGKQHARAPSASKSDAAAATINEVARECRRLAEGLLLHSERRQAHCQSLAVERVRYLRGLPDAIDGHVQKCKFELQEVAESATATLSTLTDAIRTSLSDLTTFRKLHQREYDASYPSSQWRVLAVALTLVAVESIINATFFKDDSDFGLVGGIITAAIVALGNVSFAFVLGGMLILRHARHTGLPNQVLSLISIFPFFATVISYNLIVAHYRTQIENKVPGAVVAAWHAFTTKVWDIGSASAVILFLLGIVVAVLAAIDGYYQDDPYPGYGPIDRRHRTAIDDLVSTEAAVEADLKAIHSKTESQLTDRLKMLEGALQQLDDLDSERKEITQEFKRHRAAIYMVGREAVREFAHATYLESIAIERQQLPLLERVVLWFTRADNDDGDDAIYAKYDAAVTACLDAAFLAIALAETPETRGLIEQSFGSSESLTSIKASLKAECSAAIKKVRDDLTTRTTELRSWLDQEVESAGLKFTKQRIA